MYYTVTEGRATILDRLNLHDRSTYGIEWMVLDAMNARDAVRQWQTFKAGIHPLQGDLELEAARYRAGAGDYLAAWEAESEIVSADIDRTLDAVQRKRRELDELEGRLEAARKTLVGPSRSRRGRQSGRRKPQAKAPKGSAQRRRAA